MAARVLLLALVCTCSTAVALSDRRLDHHFRLATRAVASAVAATLDDPEGPDEDGGIPLPDRTWQSYLYVLGGVAVLFSAVLAALLYCSCGWLKRKSATSSPLPYLAAVKVDPDDKNSPPSTSSSVSVQDHLIPGSACIPPSLWIPALQARPVSIALSELEPPRRTWIRDSSSTIGSSYGSGSGSPTTASPPLTPSSPTFASQFNGYAPAPLSSPALLAPPNSGWPSAEGTRARGSYAASRSDENLVSHGYAS